MSYQRFKQTWTPRDGDICSIRFTVREALIMRDMIDLAARDDGWPVEHLTDFMNEDDDERLKKEMLWLEKKIRARIEGERLNTHSKRQLHQGKSR